MNLFKNSYINTLLSIVIIIYASTLKSYNKIYNNCIFKFLLLLFILILSKKDIQLSFSIIIAYLIIYKNIIRNNVDENMDNIDHYMQLEYFTQEYTIDNIL